MEPAVAAVSAAALLARLEHQLSSALEWLLESRAQDWEWAPEGKWSARQMLAHMGRYHEIFMDRLQRILNEERPMLGRYRAEDDPGFAEWAALPRDEIVERTLLRRGELIERLRKLSAGDWRRIGEHPLYGPLELGRWVEFFLLHEAHHIYGMLLRIRRQG